MTRTKSRETGTHIIVQRADDGGDEFGHGRWETICDEHSTVISHDTKALAVSHSANPLGWCEVCMRIKELTEARFVVGEAAVFPEHYLRWVTRKTLGGSPIKGGGMFYGTTGTCRCGERFTTNEAPPSKGGRKIIEQIHRGHVTKLALDDVNEINRFQEG